MRTWLAGSLVLIVTVALAPAAGAPPPIGECRPLGTGERPSQTADDIVNCVVTYWLT
ncbi:MAG: hypothetical protein QN137_14050 [Armatimonadota bacterium]|nr:hypothetical protein [Armatimonadota bacterium]